MGGWCQEAFPGGVFTTLSDLNLRVADDPFADIVLVVPRGASVTATGAINKLNGYIEATYAEATGWILGSLLA